MEYLNETTTRFTPKPQNPIQMILFFSLKMNNL